MAKPVALRSDKLASFTPSCSSKLISEHWYDVAAFWIPQDKLRLYLDGVLVDEAETEAYFTAEHDIFCKSSFYDVGSTIDEAVFA